MWKKVISLFLVLCMLTSLIGCGVTPDISPDNGNNEEDFEENLIEEEIDFNVIAEEGGIFELTDGAKVEIGINALNMDATLSFKKLDFNINKSDDFNTDFMYEIKFAEQNVKILIPIKISLLIPSGFNESSVAIARFFYDGNYEIINGKANLKTNTNLVSAMIKETGLFVVMPLFGKIALITGIAYDVATTAIEAAKYSDEGNYEKLSLLLQEAENEEKNAYDTAWNTPGLTHEDGEQILTDIAKSWVVDKWIGFTFGPIAGLVWFIKGLIEDAYKIIIYAAVISDVADVLLEYAGKSFKLHVVSYYFGKIGLEVETSLANYNGPAPLEVEFSGFVSGGITPYTYKWDFGDGNWSEEYTDVSIKSLHYIYEVPGEYKPVLHVEDNEGREGQAETEKVVVSESDINGDITNVSPLTDPFTLDAWYITYVYVENTGNTSHTFKVKASEPSGTDFEVTEKSITLSAGATNNLSFKYKFYGTETCRTLTFKLYDSSNNLLDPYTTGTLCPVDVTTIPTVNTLTAYTITKTAATLYGEITSTGGLTVTRRGFQYKDSAGGSTFDWHENGDWSANDYIHRITGLVAGHTYLYRAYAVNDKGTGYGAWESFKTTEEIITSPSVTTVGADNIQETSIRFKGRIDDTGGEDADWRGFRIEDTVTGWTYYPKQESGPYGTGNYYITYVSLTPGRTYKYKAWAHNSAGTGSGLEKSVTTQVSNQLVSIESSISSVSLRWGQMLMPMDYTITAHYSNGSSADIWHIYCTWFSSKPGVVHVNEGGIITPLVQTADFAIITMTYTEGGITKSDTIAVTVLPYP